MGERWEGINESLATNDYETRGTEERDQFGQIASRFMVTAARTLYMLLSIVVVVTVRFVSSPPKLTMVG